MKTHVLSHEAAQVAVDLGEVQDYGAQVKANDDRGTDKSACVLVT